MKDVNLVIIMGNLTRDPELRYTPNGQPVASLGVATNRSWSDAAGEKKDEVEFHDVVVWGKLAELCSQYLTKGRKVHIMGRLQTRNWEAPDGGKRQKTEIIANDIVFVDRGKDLQAGEAKESQKPAKGKEVQEEEINIDDIPF